MGNTLRYGKKQDMEIQPKHKILTQDFILGFFATLTFFAAHQILYPTLPIYLSKLGSKEAEIGILIGVFGVSSLVFRPFIGKALLKNPEKHIMIAGTFLFAFTAIAYFVAQPFWPFLMVRFIQGIGFAFYSTASLTLIANISQPAHLGQSLSYFLLATNLSLAIAPVLGVFLINHFGFNLLFLVCLGLSLSSLFITNKLGRRAVVPSERPSIGRVSFFCWKALPPSVISSIMLIIWGALTAFFPLYAINQGIANPGFFFTTIAIMLILGRTVGMVACCLIRRCYRRDR
jgi:MFS family permease